MKDKCDYCEIRRNCDWLAEMCRLSDREVAQRPHLILKPLVHILSDEERARGRRTQGLKRGGRKGYAKGLAPYMARQKKLNAMGFRKYDGRVRRLVK